MLRELSIRVVLLLAVIPLLGGVIIIRTPCVGLYCQGFEETLCANEKGIPNICSINMGITEVCDFEGAGVTEGSQAYKSAGAGSYMWNVACTYQGTSPLYVEFTLLVDSNTHNAYVSAFLMATTTTPAYPSVALKGDVNEMDIQCAAATYGGSPFTYVDDTTYLLQLDVNQTASSTQTLRIYNFSTKALLDTLTCDRAGASNINGTQFYYGGGLVVGDSLLIDDSVIAAP